MPNAVKGIQLGNNVTELTAIAPLKPGGADTLRMILGQRKAAEDKGEPSPIEQIESIHYARWVIIDGGTRLLFTSNFDGDLEGYLSEFAERDEGPLNFIFGTCVGWPGVRPLAPFIKYVQDHMVPAEYYYSAYPRHTVKEIQRSLYWKERTENAIRDLLPELADMKSLEDARDKIRKFLIELAVPTPERPRTTHPTGGTP